MARRRKAAGRKPVRVKAHSRSPRGSNRGKPRPRVRGYKRGKPPKSSYPR